MSVGHQPGADLGPVISPASKERICDLVQSGAEQGAKVMWLDEIFRVKFRQQ